jgi:hypothetical protein
MDENFLMSSTKRDLLSKISSDHASWRVFDRRDHARGIVDARARHRGDR